MKAIREGELHLHECPVCREKFECTMAHEVPTKEQRCPCGYWKWPIWDRNA